MKSLLSFCQLLFSMFVLRASEGDTVRYSFLNQGKIVGKQLSWKKDNLHRGYYYDFNDRGRGPSITQYVEVNEQGIILREDIDGVDYYKTPVHETFSVKNGFAFWKNKFENDSARFSNQVYSDINGTPASLELVLKMARSASHKHLDVLPAGNRTFEEIRTERITGKNDQDLAVTLYAISGYGGAPTYCWFTGDGTFFASLNDWTSILLDGFEQQEKSLLAIQKVYEQAFYTNLAKKITQKNTPGLAIKDVNLFNSVNGSVTTHATVLVRNGLIEKTGNAAAISIPSSYKIIDGKNKFLLPGLWEMHAHFRQESGPFMLAQGVTNLRDMGNGASLLSLRHKVKMDSILGPDISVISGFIDQAGEYAGPTGAIIHSLDEGLKAIGEYKSKGYDQIKLYSSIDPAWVKPLAAKAHSLGMRVCGHIPAFMTASQAIDAGYDEITHLNMLMLNFFGDTVDTRNMTRFRLVGRKGYTIDLKSEAALSLLKKMKEKNIAHDPTITVFENMFVDLPGKPSATYAPILQYLPAEIKRNALAGGFFDDDSLVNTYARSYETMKQLLKTLYDNKITIVSGTDGGILQHELEAYVQCGIPNAEVLRMATIIPATLSGKNSAYGSIEAGKTANMILVDGNPLKNITDIRKVTLTIKEGKSYSPKEIYAAYGWKYFN